MIEQYIVNDQLRENIVASLNSQNDWEVTQVTFWDRRLDLGGLKLKGGVIGSHAPFQVCIKTQDLTFLHVKLTSKVRVTSLILCY